MRPSSATRSAAAWRRRSRTSTPSAASCSAVASGGAGREVNLILRLAAAPFAELVMPPLQWPLGKLGGTLVLEGARRAGTDIGRDAEELKIVFEGLPDGSSCGVSPARCARWSTGVVRRRDDARPLHGYFADCADPGRQGDDAIILVEHAPRESGLAGEPSLDLPRGRPLPRHRHRS
ncbi:MAG: hypothetical protein U0Q22_14610 [Acidimicrobiales bacterium]